MMKYLILVYMCTLMINIGYVPSENWSQFGHDSQHTFASETAISDQLRVKWKYHIETEMRSSPAVVGENVYILDHQNLFCLGLEAGDLLYKVPAYSKCPYTPTVLENRVYIPAEEDLFICIDALTGDALWENKLTDLHWVNPLVRDNLLYITVDNVYVTRLLGFKK
jgi:outer membrane protein assembly factor BamB